MPTKRGDLGEDSTWVRLHFFRQPDRAEVIYFVKYVTLVVGVFLMVYVSSNRYASQLSHHYRFYFPWELKIPLVESMIFIYASLYLMAFLHLFILTKTQIRKTAQTLLYTIVISGVIFYFFPTINGYPWPPQAENLAWAFKIMGSVDYPHSLFPSLHIVMGYIFSRTIMHRDHFLWDIFIGCWFLGVCASIVLVHQHHLSDIVGGYFVGHICYKLAYTGEWKWSSSLKNLGAPR